MLEKWGVAVPGRLFGGVTSYEGGAGGGLSSRSMNESSHLGRFHDVLAIRLLDVRGAPLRGAAFPRGLSRGPKDTAAHGFVATRGTLQTDATCRLRALECPIQNEILGLTAGFYGRGLGENNLLPRVTCGDRRVAAAKPPRPHPLHGTMADAVSTSRFAITAIAPRARVRRARRLAAAATTGRPVSRRAAAAESSGEASAEAAESVTKDGGDDPDSSSPEMFDNLANIFLKRDQEDWIGLLASSERWPTLRDGFFARLKTRAAEEEDPEDMLRLSRLLRLMQGTSERVAIYQDLLAEVQDTGEEMWEGMVTSRRASSPRSFSSSSGSSSRRWCATRRRPARRGARRRAKPTRRRSRRRDKARGA